MANIEIIQPISQPTGDFRLLNWLNENFNRNTYNSFQCLVAFAKVKPFYKMHESIRKWKALGKNIEAIIGIDHKGTSVQALQYALSNFQHTYILHADHSTFHPKLYIFSGDTEAAVYYGSNNLTSGGLETNFEGGIILTLTLPEDAMLLEQAKASFESLLPSSVPCCVALTNEILQQLNESGLLLDENIRKTARNSNITTSTTNANSGGNGDRLFAPYRIKPPKAISKAALAAAAASAGIPVTSTVGSGSTAVHSAPNTPTSITIPSVIVDGLVMQVTPHHNGEILLSKIAVGQNPSFFGFPFTGRTVPKKATNPTYPQRDPDPIVNIYVYDSTGVCVRAETQYNLNTVFYEKKTEIRITITPSILDGLNYNNGTDYPIMVMSNSEMDGCDYDLHFYAKGSTEYDSYLEICDQSLPSGGKPVARKMGWI